MWSLFPNCPQTHVLRICLSCKAVGKVVGVCVKRLPHKTEPITTPHPDLCNWKVVGTVVCRQMCKNYHAQIAPVSKTLTLSHNALELANVTCVIFDAYLPPTYKARWKVMFSACFSVHRGERVPLGHWSLSFPGVSLVSGRWSFVGYPLVLLLVLYKILSQVLARGRGEGGIPQSKTGGIPIARMEVPLPGHGRGNPPPNSHRQESECCNAAVLSLLRSCDGLWLLMFGSHTVPMHGVHMGLV